MVCLEFRRAIQNEDPWGQVHALQKRGCHYTVCHSMYGISLESYGVHERSRAWGVCLSWARGTGSGVLLQGGRARKGFLLGCLPAALLPIDLRPGVKSAVLTCSSCHFQLVKIKIKQVATPFLFRDPLG